jgi:hypothetical protein
MGKKYAVEYDKDSEVKHVGMAFRTTYWDWSS